MDTVIKEKLTRTAIKFFLFENWKNIVDRPVKNAFTQTDMREDHVADK